MVEVLWVLEKMKEQVLRVPYKTKEVEGSRIFKKRKRRRGRRKNKNANFRCISDYVEWEAQGIYSYHIGDCFQKP